MLVLLAVPARPGLMATVKQVAPQMGLVPAAVVVARTMAAWAATRSAAAYPVLAAQIDLPLVQARPQRVGAKLVATAQRAAVVAAAPTTMAAVAPVALVARVRPRRCGQRQPEEQQDQGLAVAVVVKVALSWAASAALAAIMARLVAAVLTEQAPQPLAVRPIRASLLSHTRLSSRARAQDRFSC